jgi:tetratricopeptide (TPR) repeat protein
MAEGGRDDRLWQRAERHLAEGNVAAARAGLEALLVRQPGHVMARLRLSTLDTAQGRYRDSLQQLLAIAGLGPEDPQLLAMLAGLLNRLGESRVALRCVADSALTRTADKSLLEEMAQLALQMADTGRAMQLLDAADQLGGPTPAALYTRATAQLFAGDLDQADATLAACLRLAPTHAQAHWALARLRRQTEADNHCARLRGLLANNPDPGSAVYLGFALFKELDDLGRHDEAWDALELACARKRQALAYRPRDEQLAFASLQGFRRRSDQPAPAPVPGQARPVFIVGMPRTGTTLLEQVLGSHPAVHNAGELDDFPLQLRWCTNRFSKSYLDPAVFDAARRLDFAQLGRRYLQHASWRAAGKAVFTDKLPLNFLHVGFIAEALPQARILHMVRNPMDTCFSNLKELFADAYPYSYDLEELGEHYGRYRRLMTHWHEQYPGRILDVSYESLVSDTETQRAAILAFCDLPAGHDQDGTAATPVVTTASSVQVREPIHRRGIDAWRSYARHLEPLQSRLRAGGWL